MIQLLQGDCRTLLPTLAADSVQCVVTSPPYFGLRDYGTGTWVGGDAECGHQQLRNVGKSNLSRHGGAGYNPKLALIGTPYRDTCGKCGAIRTDAQIGLECTPAEYIATLVEVFREVRRVLRPDGVLFLNLGDSYASQGGPGAGGNAERMGRANQERTTRPNGSYDGIKPKDLMMMPARVALALQEDGWWLRSDIIWAKPNPMPESVTDRPTSAHEHVFMLAKSAKYFWDAKAVQETAISDRQDVGIRTGEGYYTGAKPAAVVHDTSSRNIRNVWTIPTAPFSQAHFATFPPALVERCIKAGTSERGCCAACAAPWARVMERVDTGRRQKMADGWDTGDGAHGTVHRNGREKGESGVPVMASVTTGWQPSCTCATDVVPCTVLDPFSGAGTTAMVADRLGRNAIGIDLSTGYGTMSRDRITADAGLFADFAPSEAS